MAKRVVLITGASSGIGEAIAKRLVLEGDFPVLVARNWPALQKLKEKLKQCEVFACDVTKQEEVERLVEEVISRFGWIDVLINNAGYGKFGGALEISLADYEGMIQTNYLGAVRLTHQVLPHMVSRGEGRIINIASLAGLTGIPNLAAYCASKFALIGFSESLRLEFAPVIQIGVLCPGPVLTPFFGEMDPTGFFPPLIASQMLDVDTVARQALRLIDRPRLKVIPRRLKWALAIRHLLPGLYFRTTQRVYGALAKGEFPTNMKG
jgi:short-subunit dehydrogenase